MPADAPTELASVSNARVLVVGAGGLGCPALRVLVQSGVRKITLLDDDVVSLDNLHRQTLYTDADVGERKIEAAKRALERLAESTLDISVVAERFVPSNAVAWCKAHDVVVEGADNLPTKFLASDAARLAQRPIAHAGVVRWQGWALLGLPNGPCLRCLFEDVPHDRVETCSEAGVVGPVVGVLGALLGALALQTINAHAHPSSSDLWHYDALKGTLRRRPLVRRAGCDGCEGRIPKIEANLYAATCAA